MPDTKQQLPTPGPETAPSRRPPRVWGVPCLPSPTCPARCCRYGNEWIQYHLAVDEYVGGPYEEFFSGHWESVQTEAVSLSAELCMAGLAPWDDLPAAARDKLSRWSPVARQLWESDFVEHRLGLVRAWIWHYLDDNIFWSAGAAHDDLVPCASPAWEHARALRRELHDIRTRHPTTQLQARLRSHSLFPQHQAWGRITENLVREGLGVVEPFATSALVAHFKASLRQLLIDGAAAIPDREDDAVWDVVDPDRGVDIHFNIKALLKAALGARHFLHGMAAVWSVRFSPGGADGDKEAHKHKQPWGFAFDEKCMTQTSPSWLPFDQPGCETPPPVGLVIEPMLAKTGFDRIKKIQGVHVWSKMKVLMPWTFDINDAHPDCPERPSAAGKGRAPVVGSDAGSEAGSDVAAGEGRARRETRRRTRGVEAGDKTAKVAPAKTKAGTRGKGKGKGKGEGTNAGVKKKSGAKRTRTK